jgi:hypothetical protein
MNFEQIILVILLFSIPFYFSKKAETLFFHLLYSYFAIHMFFTMELINPLYNQKLIVGLGLLLPQIKFIIYFIKDSILTIKMMTSNTYYFFITLYYKFIRFYKWIKSTFVMLKVFFTTFSFKKEDYQDEQSSQDNYSYEKRDRKFYEEQKQEEQNNYHQEQTKQKEYKQDYTQQEKIKNEPRNKYKRFYSSNAYIVLDVSPNDEYKTIKQAYRKLVRIYHPDLNPDNILLYTEITQNINNAWEKLEKIKK